MRPSLQLGFGFFIGLISKNGLRKKEIIELSKKAGFEICEFSRFMLKINMFFVFKKVK